jgi:hypothetical protein
MHAVFRTLSLWRDFKWEDLHRGWWAQIQSKWCPKKFSWNEGMHGLPLRGRLYIYWLCQDRLSNRWREWDASIWMQVHPSARSGSDSNSDSWLSSILTQTHDFQAYWLRLRLSSILTQTHDFCSASSGSAWASSTMISPSSTSLVHRRKVPLG